ncbi:hypothetical protein HRbin22_01063 [Candidatus Thermoflexus japonica]|uniref:Uncharacterized protein n=1 Tax=Candidatus Thermoflexus japonica TaxID=2035417 RepID=A0A2H5Y5U7_9CHLR|nr:hypothetical protein HRbin22_01063 [Candidatus Thermoflexus japonica]
MASRSWPWPSVGMAHPDDRAPSVGPSKPRRLSSSFPIARPTRSHVSTSIMVPCQKAPRSSSPDAPSSPCGPHPSTGHPIAHASNGNGPTAGLRSLPHAWPLPSAGPGRPLPGSLQPGSDRTGRCCHALPCCNRDPMGSSRRNRVFGRDAAEVRRKLSGRSEEALRARGVLIGTPSEIRDPIERLGEAGVERRCFHGWTRTIWRAWSIWREPCWSVKIIFRKGTAGLFLGALRAIPSRNGAMWD